MPSSMLTNIDFELISSKGVGVPDLSLTRHAVDDGEVEISDFSSFMEKFQANLVGWMFRGC